MSRIPSLTARELIAALERAGYVRSRQSGSHLILKHATRQKVVIPVHARDIKRPLMLRIIRDTGLSEDEFLELL